MESKDTSSSKKNRQKNGEITIQTMKKRNTTSKKPKFQYRPPNDLVHPIILLLSTLHSKVEIWLWCSTAQGESSDISWMFCLNKVFLKDNVWEINMV